MPSLGGWEWIIILLVLVVIVVVVVVVVIGLLAKIAANTGKSEQPENNLEDSDSENI